jgi:hypothetical protein
VPGEIYILHHRLKGWPTNLLHGVLKGANYDENLEALENRFGDQHLAAVYHCQKEGQGVGESFQELSTAVKQLTRHTYLRII